MNRSLRQIATESHVAAITIANLLLFALDGTFRALAEPVSRAAGFLFTAMAIFDIPYFSKTFTIADRVTLIIIAGHLYTAVVSVLAAWLLSRCAYGQGPIRSLYRYYTKIR